MKLRNKKTGEIVEFRYLQTDYVAPLVLTTHENDKPEMYSYNSLTELNEEWEDYEEPKEYWYIDCDGDVYSSDRLFNFDLDRMSNINNCFETVEEAEKAVEKLKAWKRLKDKGFRFDKWANASAGPYSPIWFYFEKDTALGDVKSDLDLLFGGE